MKPTKEQIIALLDAWIRQRPGLDYGNYGDPVAYRAEVRSIGKDLQHARTLLRAVELSLMPVECLIDGFRAFSGRLSLIETPKGYALDYTTGQYWPTEYRKAACAVLSSALWQYKREHCMLDGSRQGASEGAMLYRNPDGRGFVSAGDYLRRQFRREFGRAIADRWFD